MTNQLSHAVNDDGSGDYDQL